MREPFGSKEDLEKLEKLINEQNIPDDTLRLLKKSLVTAQGEMNEITKIMMEVKIREARMDGILAMMQRIANELPTPSETQSPREITNPRG